MGWPQTRQRPAFLGDGRGARKALLNVLTDGPVERIRSLSSRANVFWRRPQPGGRKRRRSVSNVHFTFPVSFAINMANQMTANPPEKIAMKDANSLH